MAEKEKALLASFEKDTRSIELLEEELKKAQLIYEEDVKNSKSAEEHLLTSIKKKDKDFNKQTASDLAKMYSKKREKEAKSLRNVTKLQNEINNRRKLVIQNQIKRN